MDRKEFKNLRQKLNKTKEEIAQLLDVSIESIYSYENGWRNIPTNVERHIFFFLSRINENQKDRNPCWVIKKCPPETKEKCPAWEFQAGDLCWFINGTICCGDDFQKRADKMECCRSCEVFKSFLQS